MPDNVHDGTPLTYVDTAWLHMEDPTNLMMVTGIFTFSRPLDFTRLRDTLQGRMVDRFPRLRHRVKQDGSSAHWVEDPTFDIDAQIHKMALPAPGDPQHEQEELKREVGQHQRAQRRRPSRPPASGWFGAAGWSSRST